MVFGFALDDQRINNKMVRYEAGFGKRGMEFVNMTS